LLHDVVISALVRGLDGNNAVKKGMWLESFEEDKELRKYSYERDPLMENCDVKVQ